MADKKTKKLRKGGPIVVGAIIEDVSGYHPETLQLWTLIGVCDNPQKAEKMAEAAAEQGHDVFTFAVDMNVPFDVWGAHTLWKERARAAAEAKAEAETAALA